jgi:transcriptional regulator with XRE-family HTH domain
LNFGQAVRASRLSRKLTQAEVATLAGVSRQAIVLLESNRGRVSTLLAVQPHAPIRMSGPPVGKTYGERVRAARGERSISQIAELAGVTANTVRAIEANGGTVTSLSQVGLAVSPQATVEPNIHKPRVWKTVHGKTNPNRAIADYYATPAPIARLLLDHENFEGSILEPCVGEARVLEIVLRERGYVDLHFFDLMGAGHERRDFFDITESYDAIVTNPPFNRHVDFVLHAKKIATKKIALLLPLNYITGKQRHSEIWDDDQFPLARVLIMNRGVNFLTDDPFAERVMSSQLYCGWFIFDRDHVGPPTMTWVDNHALIARR